MIAEGIEVAHTHKSSGKSGLILIIAMSRKLLPFRPSGLEICLCAAVISLGISAVGLYNFNQKCYHVTPCPLCIVYVFSIFKHTLIQETAPREHNVKVTEKVSWGAQGPLQDRSTG